MTLYNQALHLRKQAEPSLERSSWHQTKSSIYTRFRVCFSRSTPACFHLVGKGFSHYQKYICYQWACHPKAVKSLLSSQAGNSSWQGHQAPMNNIAWGNTFSDKTAKEASQHSCLHSSFLLLAPPSLITTSPESPKQAL